MSALQGTLLIVDDEELNRDGLARRLQRHDYEVQAANSGREAIELLGNRQFDLVLLDIMMPGINGLEVLKFLRRVDSLIDLPIIMVTAKGGSEDVIEALELGANDYVTKPLDFPVVLARIRTQLALRRAVARVKQLEARHDAHNRELRAATEALTAANDRHAQDLQAAARVQRALLPVIPSEIGGTRFAWALEPCSHLTSCCLNVSRLGDRHAGLCVSDVSGHGVAAALLSVTLSQHLAQVARGPAVAPPAEVAARLGQVLNAEATAGCSVSLLYGVLALDSGEFRFVSAGNPGPVHTANGRPPTHHEVTGFPISVARAEYKEQTITLVPGERLILYSDGLTEVRNAEGEHFGIRRLLAAMDEGRRLPIADAVGGLVRSVEHWREGVPRQDDIAALLVEWTGPSAPADRREVSS
jgi:sigma-B regulation protein RsbU (phosphoserine phosphatase)